MALDTALKRGSALNISCPWRGILPLPDGTVGQPDRQVVPFMYSGISAGEPVIPPEPEPVPVPEAVGGGRTYWPGYIPPRKKKKKEEEVTVEIAVEQVKEERIVKYIAVQPVQTMFIADNAEILQAVQPLIKLLENNSIRSRIVKQKIEELEEEEDILAIVKLLQ